MGLNLQHRIICKFTLLKNNVSPAGMFEDDFPICYIYILGYNYYFCGGYFVSLNQPTTDGLLPKINSLTKDQHQNLRWNSPPNSQGGPKTSPMLHV